MEQLHEVLELYQGFLNDRDRATKKELKPCLKRIIDWHRISDHQLLVQ